MFKKGDKVRSNLKDLKHETFEVMAIEANMVHMVNIRTWASWTVPAKILFK